MAGIKGVGAKTIRGLVGPSKEVKNMRNVIMAVLTLFLVGCASVKPDVRPWTKGEKIGAAFYLAGHGADMYTTIRHQDYPDKIYERNPILGKHPEDHKIYLYMGVTTGLILLISHYVPKLRLPLCIGCGGLGFYLAWGNYKLIREVR